jgi:hypothetical protein
MHRLRHDIELKLSCHIHFRIWNRNIKQQTQVQLYNPEAYFCQGGNELIPSWVRGVRENH